MRHVFLAASLARPVEPQNPRPSVNRGLLVEDRARDQLARK